MGNGGIEHIFLHGFSLLCLLSSVPAVSGKDAVYPGIFKKKNYHCAKDVRGEVWEGVLVQYFAHFMSGSAMHFKYKNLV